MNEKLTYTVYSCWKDPGADVSDGEPIAYGKDLDELIDLAKSFIKKGKTANNEWIEIYCSTRGHEKMEWSSRSK